MPCELNRKGEYMKKVNYSILEQNYKLPDIDEKTIEGILAHPQFYRGHLRTAIGKIYKKGEFEKRRDEVFARELP